MDGMDGMDRLRTVYCVFTISVAVCGMLEIRYRLLRPLIETNSVNEAWKHVLYLVKLVDPLFAVN